MPLLHDTIMWVELCTDCEADWNEAITICAKAFSSQQWFSLANQDREESFRFTKAYFQYIYKTELSEGRGGLACVKTRMPNGTVAIAYVSLFIYNRQRPPIGDKTEMERISKELTDINFDGDAWIERYIHDKIRDAAQSMQFSYIFGVLDAVAPEFAGNRIGTRYMDRCMQVVYMDGVRRGLINQICVLYGVIDEPKAAKITRGNRLEVAHLHKSKDAVCLRSQVANAGQILDDCVIIMGTPIDGKASTDILERLKTIFENNLTLSRM